MTEEEHNGPGFHYVVRWRRHDLAPTAKFEERPVDSKSSMVIIDGQSVYKPYEIYVLSVNDAGDAVSPPRMLIGYSSEDGLLCCTSSCSAHLSCVLCVVLFGQLYVTAGNDVCLASLSHVQSRSLLLHALD